MKEQGAYLLKADQHKRTVPFVFIFVFARGSRTKY